LSRFFALEANAAMAQAQVRDLSYGEKRGRERRRACPLTGMMLLGIVDLSIATKRRVIDFSLCSIG